MKKIERVLFGFALVFTIIYFFHIAFSTIILGLSYLLLVILYGFFGVAFLNGIRGSNIFRKTCYRELPNRMLFGAVLLGISFALVLFGAIRKLNLFPPPHYFLHGGLIILLALVLINLYLSEAKTLFDLRKHLIRLCIIVIFGLIMLLVPSESLVDIYYRKYPARVIELRKKLLKDPENKEIKDQLIVEIEKYNKNSAGRKFDGVRKKL